MKKRVFIGSLFDGIGGWPLAATKVGIEPVWASEIEEFPITVTQKHFPGVKHLGDVTKINGAEIEPVDIITSGSPCQDLSIAGKRRGLDGERSCLFKESIRIVREMRTATCGEYPRFFVWENVPGAFSSNKRDDFRTVLEEITESKIPMPKSGRWANAGMVRSGSCEVAWRVLDAQFWGVPQRRKRIFLVADFRGQCAGEILFKPESVSRYIAESSSERERVARNIEDSTRKTILFEPRSQDGVPRIHDEICPTLNTAQGGQRQPCVVQAIGFKANASISDNAPVINEGVPTMQTTSQLAVCYGADLSQKAEGICWKEEVAACLTNGTHAGHGCHVVRMRSGCEGGGKGALVSKECALTLATSNDMTVFQPIAYSIAGNIIDRKIENGGNGKGINKEVSFTLNTIDRHAVLASGKNCTGTLMANCATKQWLGNQEAFSGDYSIIQLPDYIVRRLTPTECERLQGLPDGYTALGSDTARYKALGNGMAQPCADFVMQGIARIYAD